MEEGLTPLLDTPHIINSEQEELKGSETSWKLIKSPIGWHEV